MRPRVQLGRQLWFVQQLEEERELVCSEHEDTQTDAEERGWACGPGGRPTSSRAFPEQHPVCIWVLRGTLGLYKKQTSQKLTFFA